MNGSKGKLYLIPTRIGDNAPLEVLPISIKKIIEANKSLFKYRYFNTASAR